MRYSSIIFDFDGTIADTGEGIMKSVKYALDAFGFKTPEDYRELTMFIGPPLLVTFEEQFGATAKEAQALVDKFRVRYNDTGIYESVLYDNIKELLIALKKDGAKIGIASSKPEKYVKELLKRFSIIEYFDSICGVSFGADCESKSSIISRSIKELGADKNETLMVGDKCFDIYGANDNGIDACAVKWGYGTKFEFIESGAKFCADKPFDIEAIALGFFEETLEYGKIYDGRIISVHNDKIKQVDGREAQREIVEHHGGVAIVGITDNDEVLLVRQFRYAYKETIYEIPAGKLEKGEDPFDAGVREFREECGAIAKEYFSLGHIYPTPGYCSEKIYIYGAKGLTYTEQDLDEGEELEVVKMPFERAVEMIMNGEIKDSKTIVGILKYKEMRTK